MNDFEHVRTAVTDYVRDYIRALRRRKMSYEKIGERLNVSHVWALQLDQPEKYGQRKVGPEVEHRLAEILHSGSVDALRKAALHLSAGVPVVVEEDGEPLEIAPTAPSDAPSAPAPAPSPARKSSKARSQRG